MFIGLDIGGTNIKSVIIDASGEILAKTVVPTGGSIAQTEDNMLLSIDVLLGDTHCSRRAIAAIGIGSAGTIDKQRGIVVTSPNIPSWKHYPIVERIEALTGHTVLLENDANAAVLGELHHGNGKLYSNWIMLTLGTGIGGGAVINGVPYTGRAGSAMEFGHITIDYNGRLCKCGRKGCLECYGSATAAVNFALDHIHLYPDSAINKRLLKPLTSRILFEEAHNGDTLALFVFNLIGTYLGIGIANLVNIFNPQAVIIGGGLSNAGEFFLPQIIQTVRTQALEGMKEHIHFAIASHNDFTAAIGAAHYAFQNNTKVHE